MLRGYENISAYSFVFNICQNFAKLVFIGLFIFVGIGSASVPWSYTLGLLTLLVLSYTYSKRYFEKLTSKKDNLDAIEQKNVRTEFLNYSIPLLFFGIISTLFYWIDSAMLGYFKSSIEVGLYNAATPIAMLLFITYELFSQLFFPMINKEYGKKKFNKIKELSKQVSKWVFMINLPALIILFFFPEIIIKIIFGSDYIGASHALQILVVGTFISSIFSISNSLVSMTGKSKIVLINIFVATILNVVLNYFLIPTESIFGINNADGINGAALATTISLIVLNCLFLIQTWRLVKILPLRRKMFQIFIAGILLAGAMIYLKYKYVFNIWSAMGTAIALVILYFVLIIIIGALDRNDKHIIGSLFNNIKKILNLRREQDI
jgi:O-antigen/teichoic acid export membrane protein